MNSKTAPTMCKAGLVVKKLDDETLVYDTDRKLAHCLDRNVATIWEHCDGKRSVDELSDLIDLESLNKKQREQVVLIMLSKLAERHLIENPLGELTSTSRLNRRELMKVAGVAALLAVPVIRTIVAPTSAHASTCSVSGQSCVTSAECCSGLCSIGACA